MKRPLFPHQKKMLKWCLERKCGALFVQMRLGKTLTMIRYANITGCKRALVIAPMSAMFAWQEELEREKEEYALILGLKTKRVELLNEGYKWNIANKEICRVLDNLHTWEWDLIIIDESSQVIRNPKTLQTKYYCSDKFKAIPRRWVLTGSPNPETEMDYFPQMRFAMGSFLGCRNYWEFRERYFKPHHISYHWAPKPGTVDRIEESLKDNSYRMRRSELNGKDTIKTRNTRLVEIPSKVMQKYIQLRDQFIYETESMEHRYKFRVQTWQKLRQLASGIDVEGNLIWDGKLNECINLLLGELKNEQSVIWTCYKQSAKSLIDAIKYKVTNQVGLIDGSVPMKSRRRNLSEFQEGDLQYLVCQVETSKSGLSLGNCDTAIYYELPASSLSFQQSQDRIVEVHKPNALYVNILTNKTVEMDLHNALWVKQMKSSKSLYKELWDRLKESV